MLPKVFKRFSPATRNRRYVKQFSRSKWKVQHRSCQGGLVSKIPPVYERPTASNISFETGGVFNVSKPCNRQSRPSSASRGVRSWPLEEESSTMDTVPLLTPTMETELLQEPWVFPQPKTTVPKAEDKTASSTWEENFQDLSGWCIMDPFQGHCDFPTGESPTFKLSGTKYEGKSGLSSEEGVLKWSTKMNTAETTEHSSDNSHNLQPTLNVTSKQDKENSYTVSSTSNLWLKISKGTTVTENTSSNRTMETNTNISAPFQSRYQIGEIDLNDTCPINFDPTENQRETWDMLRTVETTGSDTFDLLSYLCDDEMRSPEGSVSTDSSIVSKPWSSSSKLSTTLPETTVKVKTEEDAVMQECSGVSTTSMVTSTTTETPVVSTRRTERPRRSVTTKVEKPYTKVKREKPARRRYNTIDSDSDDHSFVSHYRESREKNNEASRKSRMNKKAKETEMAVKANELERDNRILKMKVEELEKLVTSMRSALLRSALKREF
ncbi:uncharacterized protein LOC108632835 [Ceratina calcarata]|uniref:Uncharacterized protein LOC108632835 n=1 Tax=Ceratina calcarata TaxID=156304 RepID=A0AAJ7W825_9HYME|nr:uncharacterized protein LOC108632835 [Ceratina calcarata]